MYKEAADFFLDQLISEGKLPDKKKFTQNSKLFVEFADRVKKRSLAETTLSSYTLEKHSAFNGKLFTYVMEWYKSKSSAPNASSSKRSADMEIEGDECEDDRKKKLKFESLMIKVKPTETFDDIVGHIEAKQSLNEAAILPLRLPHFFYGARKPWKGVLFYGPPGTGKSFLAKALAHEAGNINFMSLKASDVLQMYVGQSKDAIKYAFETARKNSPCIIFIDEVDFLCGNREESDKNLKGVISEVLTQMESINDNNKGVLVVGATNMPEKLDSAVRRRFEKRIYVGLPSETEREAMFSKMLIGNRHNLSELDMKKLAKMTKGYSGADINVVVREALMMPIRSLMDSKFFKLLQDGMWSPCKENESGATKKTWKDFQSFELNYDPPIGLNELIEALKKITRTVQINELQKFEKFTSEFGLKS